MQIKLPHRAATWFHHRIDRLWEALFQTCHCQVRGGGCVLGQSPIRLRPGLHESDTKKPGLGGYSSTSGHDFRFDLLGDNTEWTGGRKRIRTAFIPWRHHLRGYLFADITNRTRCILAFGDTTTCHRMLPRSRTLEAQRKTLLAVRLVESRWLECHYLRRHTDREVEEADRKHNLESNLRSLEMSGLGVIEHIIARYWLRAQGNARSGGCRRSIWVCSRDH